MNLSILRKLAYLVVGIFRPLCHVVGSNDNLPPAYLCLQFGLASGISFRVAL